MKYKVQNTLLSLLIFSSVTLAKEVLAKEALAEDKLATEELTQTNGLFDWIEFDVRAKYEGLKLENTNLNSDDDVEKEYETESKLRVNTHILKDEPISGFMELQLSHTIKRETGEDKERETKLELNQLFVRFKEIIKNVDARIGRWLYRDQREWLIDENFDGVFVRGEHENWQLDVFGGRVDHWQKDLLDSATKNDEPVDTGNIMLSYFLNDDQWVSTYVVYQKETEDEKNKYINYGVRAYNDVDEEVNYWLDLGFVAGDEESETVSGYALDIGGTYYAKSFLNPRYTLSYAFGSGDKSDDDLSGYRQTGLQGNEGTFGGVTKFKYYGETLDPELKNLHIITAGVGIEIFENATLDLVYHYYRQDHLAELERKVTEFDPDNDELDTKYLGSSLDLVVGAEIFENFSIEAAVGVFKPSSRFVDSNDDKSDYALSAWFEVEYSF